jgi:hypothetical protein
MLDSAPEPLPPSLPADLPLSTVSEIASWLVGHRINTVERELILHTLDHCSGNRVWAASLLGVSPRSLEQKLRGYARQGIAVPEPSEDAESVEPVEDLGLEEDELRQDNEQRVKSPPRLLIGAGIAAAAILIIGVAAFRMLGGGDPSTTAAVPSSASGLEVSTRTEAMPVIQRNQAGAPAKTAVRPPETAQEARKKPAATSNGGSEVARAAATENKGDGVPVPRADAAPAAAAAKIDSTKPKEGSPEPVPAAAAADGVPKTDGGKPIAAAPVAAASSDPADAADAPQSEEEPTLNPPKRPVRAAAPAARPAPAPQAQQRPATDTGSFPILFPFGSNASPRPVPEPITPVVRPHCCGD